VDQTGASPGHNTADRRGAIWALRVGQIRGQGPWWFLLVCQREAVVCSLVRLSSLLTCANTSVQQIALAPAGAFLFLHMVLIFQYLPQFRPLLTPGELR
jgi:hypothetical protein